MLGTFELVVCCMFDVPRVPPVAVLDADAAGPTNLPEDELRFDVEVSAPESVDAYIDGTSLTLAPLDGFEGSAI